MSNMIVVYCTKIQGKNASRKLQPHLSQFNVIKNGIWFDNTIAISNRAFFYFIVFKTKIRLNYVIPVRKQPHVT